MNADPGFPSGTVPRPATTASDGSLLRRLQGGENDAATELFLRYATRLRALATAQTSADVRTRVDPEDIVQSVFRTFFRRAAQGQYDVPAGEELWKLFLVIGLNKIRAVSAHHKAAKRDVRQTGSGEAFEQAVETAPTNDETALAVLKMTIDELLGASPPVYREIVELRIAGHDVNEIAARVGRAKRSVERILQEFRTRLSELIHEAP